MIYKYKVSLPGIKGFARIYEVKGSTTLFKFHKRMRVDMDFPQDQMILFKAFNEKGLVSSRYAMFDMGAGTIDTVTIEQTIKNKELKFTYFYDTTNKKSVEITYNGEGIEDPNNIYPLLSQSHGPNPIEFENGYVAFEDLSEDKKKAIKNDEIEEEDEMEEEEEDETEEIYEQ